jgi:hypothetical protein
MIILACVISLTAQVLTASAGKNASSDINSYQVEAVDVSKNALTIKSVIDEVTLTVMPDADITLDGAPASLRDLHPPMSVKVTLTEPGVAQRIEAFSAEAARQGAPIPSIDLSQDQTNLNSQSERVLKVKVTPGTPDEFILNNVHKGMKIGFRYAGGVWRGYGRIHPANPDDINCPDRFRLAISLPSADGKPGEAVAVVPAYTSQREFIFVAKQDYPSLVLRINDKSFAGSDPVMYYLRVEPDQDGPSSP